MINLLPEELRKKEEAERQAAPKPTPPPFTWREPTLSKGVEQRGQRVPLPSSQTSKPTPPQPRAEKTPVPSALQPLRATPRFLDRLRALFVRAPKTTPLAAPIRIPEKKSPQGKDASLDVNLLLGEGVEGKQATLFHIVTVSAIVLGVTVMLLVGSWVIIRKIADGRMARLTDLDAKAIAARREVSQAQERLQGVANLGGRLTQAARLLTTHPSIEGLITFLERETHEKIQIGSIAVRPEENRVSLTAIALDIPTVVEQLLHWAQARETVAALAITSVSREERPEFAGSMYTFEATIEFVPSVFHPFTSSTDTLRVP